MESLLERGLKILNFPEERIPVLCGILETYIRELLLFNSAYDLVGADSWEDIAVRHILDSLAALSVLRRFLKTDSRIPPVIGDIGSGGGLPGIPLAAALPEASFVLVERMSKRCAFLENCIAVLGLNNVRVANMQAERFPKRSLDMAVFRALKPLDRKTARMLLSLLAADGVLAAYKARMSKIEEEMAAIHGIIPCYDTVRLSVPFLGNHERNLVIIKKE